MTHAKFTAAAGSMMRSEAVFGINDKVAKLWEVLGSMYFGGEMSNWAFGNLCCVKVFLFLFAIFCCCVFLKKFCSFIGVLFNPSPDRLFCVCKIKAAVLCVALQRPVIKSNAKQRLFVCQFFSDDAIFVSFS